MSYMLSFPPGPLPPDIRSPPYVKFSIQDKDVSDSFPSEIPLAMVLHFAPKLKQWMLPAPERLPQWAKYLSLRKPYVGINIREPIIAKSLLFILNRMLQVSGLPTPGGNFDSTPNIVHGASIMKAWRTLELPEAGCKSLERHLEMKLMLGDAVTLEEMVALWDAFAVPSPVLGKMVENFIRAHEGIGYTPNISREMYSWIRGNKERKKFFLSFKGKFRKKSAIVANRGAKGKLTTILKPPKQDGLHKFTWGDENKTSEILTRTGTIKVTALERKERENRDSMELKRRLRRLRSDESMRSVETVIFDPVPASPAQSSKSQRKPASRTASEDKYTSLSEYRNTHNPDGRRKDGLQQTKLYKKESSRRLSG
jgi:hypothetical protein